MRRLPGLIKAKGFPKVLVVADRGPMGLRLLDGFLRRSPLPRAWTRSPHAVEAHIGRSNTRHGAELCETSVRLIFEN